MIELIRLCERQTMTHSSLGGVLMTERKKPTKDLASKAGKALKTGKATPKTIKSLASRVLDSEKNDPDPPSTKGKRKSKK